MILKAGDHFGEMALLDKRRREAAVVARSHCHLLQLDAQDFEHLMTTRPAIAEHINEIAGMRREEGWTAGDPADPESGEPDVPHLKPKPAGTSRPGVDALGGAALDLDPAREKP